MLSIRANLTTKIRLGSNFTIGSKNIANALIALVMARRKSGFISVDGSGLNL
jgi:hypothetical protein